ncbi:class I SAM-dependent methyltransferase [Konateibacter massiliensis]|uniref:class I SAM-dependent methyltransferase n=1 Tax=Konateibacter massiliensis TaxID=2002841 RepID=UPI000C14914A|nr:class I SAM-dependent methyltransferase [Konateibacter massiliensis]
MGNTDKFEMIANRYDTAERIQIAKVSSNAIHEYLTDTKDKDAIDFGCGTGLVGMDLLNDFHSILFLDASQNMINQIEQKISNSNIQNVTTLCFDFERDSLSDLHADYIFMAQVLLHINDVELILSKLYELLNEGGHLLIVDFDKNEKIISDMVHNGFDQAELTAIMTKIGYKDMQSKTFYNGNKIFMGQDASLFILDAQK